MGFGGYREVDGLGEILWDHALGIIEAQEVGRGILHAMVLQSVQDAF